MMTACWRYLVLCCNSFMVFGAFYSMQIPIALQNEIMNTKDLGIETNNTNECTYCTVCLGLGEVRYNLLFSVSRWTSAALSLPFGFLTDRLGNGRSAVLLSVLSLLGSVLFSVGSMLQASVTTPMYILMVLGNALIALVDGPMRFVQTRVVAHTFADDIFTALAFSAIGFSGQAISLYATPNMSRIAGVIPAIWLGALLCGCGVVFAVILAFLLQQQAPDIIMDTTSNIRMSLSDFRELSAVFWLYVLGGGLVSACWITKQSNLPDYLEVLHGYSMTEASYITGISTVMFLLSPCLCFMQKLIGCNGILITFFMAWMIPFYAFLGFCPSVNIYIIAFADGIGLCAITVLLPQILVAMCPASFVGTLTGLMYLLRNTIIAVTFVATGYIIQDHSATDTKETLRNYKHFFLMLIIMSSTGLIFGIMMNVLDIRKTSVLNSRIGKWKQSNIEAIGLLSMVQPSSNYFRMKSTNVDTLTNDPPAATSVCNDDLLGKTD